MMGIEVTNRERDYWLRRVEATGRAQSRYIWLLFLSGLFYAALRGGPSTNEAITVPVVDIKLDRYTVLASGAPVMAFLVLVVMGAIRSWTHAVEMVRGSSPASDVEQLDTYPNAIDLAVYTTSESPTLLRGALSFAYPFYLLGALVESAWLAAPMLTGQDALANRWSYAAVGVAIYIPAAVLVLRMWGRRIRDLLSKRRAA